MYYIGSSVTPLERVCEHNSGKVTATRSKGPWVIRFTQLFSSVTEAREMEYRLKRLKRRDYIEEIIKDGFIKMKL